MRGFVEQSERQYAPLTPIRTSCTIGSRLSRSTPSSKPLFNAFANSSCTRFITAGAMLGGAITPHHASAE